jgi:hypothetical protein
MRQDRHKEWIDTGLREVLHAVGSNSNLRKVLVFKGARILNEHLGTHRQSLDIDSSLDAGFSASMPDRDDQAEWFREQLEQALRVHYESQDPVRYSLGSVVITKSPKKFPHPRGWDGLVAEIRVSDELLNGIKGLPTLELEMAAPELLGPDAVCELHIDGFSIQAYSLHRIAGEKLRAFLTSLPNYRRKMNSNERVARAKDLHDLVRILKAQPITEEIFWRKAADEFKLACESRYVDCAGIETFRERWESTRITYLENPTLKTISWEEVEWALTEVIGFYDKFEVFPISHPLPEE